MLCMNGIILTELIMFSHLEQSKARVELGLRPYARNSVADYRVTPMTASKERRCHSLRICFHNSLLEDLQRYVTKVWDSIRHVPYMIHDTHHHVFHSSAV